MTEELEFELGFADDHDDWGTNVNPERLDTLYPERIQERLNTVYNKE